MATLWLQERASDGKLVVSLEKPKAITGRLISVTATIINDDVHFTDVTDGGFFSVPIQDKAP